MRMKIIDEKIAFNDDIHVGETFTHKSGYKVEITDIYILGSNEPALTYEREDRPGKPITLKGSENIALLLNNISRGDAEFYRKKGMKEAFGSIVIPYGDKGKKFKIGKDTKEQDVKKAIEWITAYVPKVINDKHVQDAKIRMDWGVKFLNTLYKKNLLGEYDFKVAYNGLCSKVRSNRQLADMYEPYRLNNNVNSGGKNESLKEETEEEKRRKRFGYYYTMSPGDIEEPLDRFNNQTMDATSDVMTGNSSGEGDASMGESYDLSDRDIYDMENEIRREMLNDCSERVLKDAFKKSFDNSDLTYDDYAYYNKDDIIDDYILNNEFYDDDFRSYIEDIVEERVQRMKREMGYE